MSGKALRRQRPAAAQIFASLVFDLSYFYAIVADFHTRIQYLFSKPGYSVLMSSHHSRSRAVRGIRQRIKRRAKQSIGKRASGAGEARRFELSDRISDCIS